MIGTKASYILCLGIVCSLLVQTGPFARSLTPSPEGSNSEKSLDTSTPPSKRAPDSAVTVQVISKVDAVFPPHALKERRQGEVVIDIAISFDGDVVSTNVVSGDPVFVTSAVEAAKHWKFKSWKYMDLPIRSWARLTFDFRIPDNSRDSTATRAAGKVIESGGIGDPIGLTPLVTKGLLVKKVQPKYPKAAKKARIEGSVVLAAVIAKDGSVSSLRVVSGPSELIDASIKAVKQWRYRPYQILGQPVEGATTVTVNFQLR